MLIEQDLIGSFEHPTVGSYRGLRRSIQFDRTPGPEPFAAPTLGEHNAILTPSREPKEGSPD